MAPLDVLPLDRAKRYLNIPAGQTKDDVEISEDFIPPAVQRVERHVGHELTDFATSTPAERLAVRMVLAEYWRTQRVSVSGGSYGGASTATAVEADIGPAGSASLEARLTDLLGASAEGSGNGGAGQPQGSFPPPLPWPDPIVVWPS